MMGCAFLGPQSLKKIETPSFVVMVFIECSSELCPRTAATSYVRDRLPDSPVARPSVLHDARRPAPRTRRCHAGNRDRIRRRCRQRGRVELGMAIGCSTDV